MVEKKRRKPVSQRHRFEIGGETLRLKEAVEQHPAQMLKFLESDMASTPKGEAVISAFGGKHKVYELVEDNPDWGIDLGVIHQI